MNGWFEKSSFVGNLIDDKHFGFIIDRYGYGNISKGDLVLCINNKKVIFELYNVRNIN